MSEDESNLTHMPASSGLEYLLYGLSAAFLPEINIHRKAGLQFATDLAEFLESDSVRIESGQWIFDCTSGVDRSELVITDSGIRLRIVRPQRNPESYEGRFRSILDTFAERFSPSVMTSSNARVHAWWPVLGDSRVFLGGHLFRIEPSRILEPIGRPVHLLGMRMLFPAYEEQDEEGGATSRSVDWEVDVKVESAITDPSKLYLEVDGSWDSPAVWSESSVSKAADRLRTVVGFVKNELARFLRHGLDESGEASGE
jgi:hypothetical protein